MIKGDKGSVNLQLVPTKTLSFSLSLRSSKMSANRSLNTNRKKKPPQAFYEPPTSQTSARIIEDARRSVRALPTERPFTPAESGRILFGPGGSSQSRPPSVYSIHARQFSASRPSTSQKLAPIEKTAAADLVKKVRFCSVYVHMYMYMYLHISIGIDV